jgi:hypothetical protein
MIHAKNGMIISNCSKIFVTTLESSTIIPDARPDGKPGDGVKLLMSEFSCKMPFFDKTIIFITRFTCYIAMVQEKCYESWGYHATVCHFVQTQQIARVYYLGNAGARHVRQFFDRR